MCHKLGKPVVPKHAQEEPEHPHFRQELSFREVIVQPKGWIRICCFEKPFLWTEWSKSGSVSKLCMFLLKQRCY